MAGRYAHAKQFNRGDAANAVLTAGGYNLRHVQAWLRALLRVILIALRKCNACRSQRQMGLLLFRRFT